MAQSRLEAAPTVATPPQHRNPGSLLLYRSWERHLAATGKSDVIAVVMVPGSGSRGLVSAVGQGRRRLAAPGNSLDSRLGQSRLEAAPTVATPPQYRSDSSARYGKV